MIGTPIALWVMGNDALVPCVLAGVVIQTAAVCVIIHRNMGTKSLLLNVLPILPLAWLVEFIGSSTGIPFGVYEYTHALQPQVGGVPLIIPLAWLMMLPPAWGIASLVIKDTYNLSPLLVRICRAGIAAAAFTAWDLFLDPQMVGWGFWEWKITGIYFGIPLTNFLGWFLVSFVFTFLLLPEHLPQAWLFIVYTITWLLQSVGQSLFWNLSGPALFGFCGMGSMVLLVFFLRQK